RISKLALEAAALADRFSREACDKKIGGLDGRFNCSSPVLSRQKLLLVEPGPEPTLFKRAIEPFGRPEILFNIGDEDARFGLRDEPEVAAISWEQRSESVNLDGSTSFERSPDNACNAPFYSRIHFFPVFVPKKCTASFDPRRNVPKPGREALCPLRTRFNISLTTRSSWSAAAAVVMREFLASRRASSSLVIYKQIVIPMIAVMKPSPPEIIT